ncbi:MAG TPA: hypothetical protein VHZ52_18380 [Acidobacteriaceae bacterium]|jgi:hypothetical protein|nr:hypothetical protein [Acidobacteriaceae bacterium]
MPSVRTRLPYFYFCMSLLIAGVVIYGFSHTIDHNLIHPHPPPPWILYLHAPVFCGWVLFFILQTVLVRTRNVRIHRTLGWFGSVLGTGLLVLGYATSTSMDRFAYRLTHDSSYAAFLSVQLNDLICFSVPFALAIYWRKRPEFHRRLMLVATCALVDAAFGRIPWLPLMYSPGGVDALILLGVARDLIVDRRVHKVYLYALPGFVCCQVICMQAFLHQWPWWLKIAEFLVR